MKGVYISCFIFLFTSCSTTNVFVKSGTDLKGKKIGLTSLNLSEQKKSAKYNSDSLCTCIGQSIEGALIPYLQQAGLTVYNISPDQKVPENLMKTVAPSEVDYVFTGAGLVDRVGSSTFVEELTIKLQDRKTGEVVVSASFSATSIRPTKAGQKIGEHLLKKLK